VLKITIWSLALLVVLPLAAEAGAKQELHVKVYLDTLPPTVSPEGFIDADNKWSRDSVKDLRRMLHKKWFHPKRGWPGSHTHFTVVASPTEADLTLTVVTRGINMESFGQRTSIAFYRNVVLFDTVPMIGVTRWISIVLSVGTYRKEFVAWASNQSRWSLGSWTRASRAMAFASASWVMANDARIRALQVQQP